jgi:hypothetical protein
MPGGRPPKFSSVEQLEGLIAAYFVDRDEKRKPYTIQGLAAALETTRETLLDYEKDKPAFAQFSDSIKRAKCRIGADVEERLLSGEQHAAGPIFWLKNHGWADKQERELSGGVTITFTDAEKEA